MHKQNWLSSVVVKKTRCLVQVLGSIRHMRLFWKLNPYRTHVKSGYHASYRVPHMSVRWRKDGAKTYDEATIVIVLQPIMTDE